MKTNTEIMENIWEFYTTKMLCKKTNLIYDFITSDEEDGLTKNLPTVAEIKKQIPNPCGWGTGMEDSMLNNPLMLDAVIYRYEVTKDESLFELADRLLDGIKLCSTISKDRGYLARSVSPFDGKSHYINSSRDQYTQVIFALFHYYNSSMMRDKDKEWITDVLVSFAERAEKNVKPETNYDYLREDGGRSIVSTMWGDELLGHEVNRLHMVYLAAWYVSRDEHWFDLYKEIRDEGVQRALIKINPRMEMYGYLQMQCSIRLLYEAEPEAEYKEKYKEILDWVARLASLYRMEELDYEEVNITFNNWRDNNATNDKRWFAPDAGDDILIDGYVYYVPVTEGWSKIMPARNITEAIFVRALGGQVNVTDGQMEDFNRALEYYDKDRHCSYAYIAAPLSYWASRYYDEVKKD